MKPHTNVVQGHPGMGVGSTTQISGYNPGYDFSISVNQNTNQGLSNKFKGNAFIATYGQQEFLNCLIFDLSLQFFSEGESARLNCTGH